MENDFFRDGFRAVKEAIFFFYSLYGSQLSPVFKVSDLTRVRVEFGDFFVDQGGLRIFVPASWICGMNLRF